MSFTLKIRPARGDTVEIDAEADMLVSEVKEIIASRLEVPSDQQRLIYSGRILKDDQTISSYKINNGDVLHLVKGGKRAGAGASASGNSNANANANANSATSTSTSSAAPTSNAVPHLAAGQGAGNPLADLTGARYAGYGLNLPSASMFGPDGGMGPAPDMNQMLSMMENPAVLESLQSMLSDPEALAANPMFQQLPAAQREQMAQVMRSDMFREILRNPETLRALATQTMQQERMFRGAAGNNSFPAPGSIDDDESGETSNANSAANANQFASLLNNPFAFGMNDFGAPGLGMNQNTATATDNRPPEERYEAQLRQLNELGFYDFDRNVSALRRSGGDVNGAVSAMLDGHI